MTIAHIVEKFAMDLGDTPPERDSWFLDYVLRSPRQAGIHLTAGWLCLQSLQREMGADAFLTCREYFGGMGAQALMVEHLFAPALRDHYVQEWSQEAVDHLGTVKPGRLVVSRKDAYDPRSSAPADLVMLDFGDLTAWKTRDGEPHRELLDRVFLMEPKAVVFTDIACRYLHLHRERYEGLLGAGTCGSYETYLNALLARLHSLYGYVLLDGYWDRWSTVMALVPAEVARNRKAITPTPESPVGLDLL